MAGIRLIELIPADRWTNAGRRRERAQRSELLRTAKERRTMLVLRVCAVTLDLSLLSQFRISSSGSAIDAVAQHRVFAVEISAFAQIETLERFAFGGGLQRAA